MSSLLERWKVNYQGMPSLQGSSVYRGVIGFMVLEAIVFVTSSQANLFVWMTVLVWILFSMATNVLLGWTGLLSFGQAALFGVGAYTDALMRNESLSPLILLLVSGLCAAVVAVLIAACALRTRGGQFAVLTLVFAQVFWLCTYRIGALQGDNGFIGLGPTNVLGINVSSTRSLYVYVSIVVALGAMILLWLRKSSLGASFLAIRDDPVRAAALGLRVRELQLTAFAISGLFAGIAGALLAQQQQIVNPDVLLFTVSGQVIIACLIGGTRWFWGPALGALVIIWLNQLVFGLTDSANLYIGLLLMAIVLIVPGGLASLPRMAADLREGRLRRSGLQRHEDLQPEHVFASSEEALSASTETSGPHD
jgi:branched-chain amino acid transport system permease protein